MSYVFILFLKNISNNSIFSSLKLHNLYVSYVITATFILNLCITTTETYCRLTIILSVNDYIVGLTWLTQKTSVVSYVKPSPKREKFEVIFTSPIAEARSPKK